MSSRILLSCRTWIIAALGALGLTTAISFVRAQSVPANSVTFQPGNSIPIRGQPLNRRPIGFGYSLPGPIFFGGYPRPAPVFPSTPVVFRGAQRPTPGFTFLGGGGQAQGALGAGGVAGGIAGGIGGGIGGAQGGIQGGIGGAQGGIAGGIGGGIQGGIGGGIQGGIGGGIQGGIGGGIGGGQQMAGGGLMIVGQNFQNPAQNLGFPQVPNPPAYIGGFGGGLITGSGIAGINGLGGGILIGGGGQAGIQGGIAGGIAGGIGGGFGGGGIGGKGGGFAGINGN